LATFNLSGQYGYLAVLAEMDAGSQVTGTALSAPAFGPLRQGATRMQVAMLIEGSAEFDAREVRAIYEKFLHRAANAAELAFWSNLMAQGAQEEMLTDSLMESDAYPSSCRVR
jgi:hypothetical protein